jgi:LCP family protein required for cell wall assembly
MTSEPDDKPHYKRYRAGRRMPTLKGTPKGRAAGGPPEGDFQDVRLRSSARRPRKPGDPALPTRGAWSRRITAKRVLLGVVAFVFGWLLLSLVLFLLSAHFERSSPPSDVASVLHPAGYPLTAPNNILVLGSDRRPKGSKEPGANTSGPSRSDTIMLIRTGGGHSARLSIPRDTVLEIPGHGMQKINAAYAFGGPALSISVVESYLGIPINHLVEVNFENFPQLIDSMGGVDYSGGCVISKVDGGSRNGGYTLRLRKGTHRLNGKQALALARTRENLCKPNENDLQREEHQQALFNDMKSRLQSFSSFVRLPWIAWNAPPTIVSDMSGPSLLGLFGALAIDGTPPTRVLQPSSSVTLPDGEVGLAVSESERRAAAARFLAG